MSAENAPGWPGIPARWTSSAKSGVGTALGEASRVWFTIGFGILDEIYYPRIDQACTRDLELIVTDGRDFFSEEKRDTRHETGCIEGEIPAFRLTNACNRGRFRIEKEILSDPWRDTLLQNVRFVPLQGGLGDYHVHVLLAPHLENHGAGNTAWTGDYKGRPMLFASRGGTALALAASVPWRGRGAGFVGVSDGWQDLHQHKRLTWQYGRAENGNVALVGELDLGGTDGSFTLALGFGTNAAEAGFRAAASLGSGFEEAKKTYVGQWQAWKKCVAAPGKLKADALRLYHISASVLRTHEAKRLPGGMIASLSIPWGSAKGDDDLGGYHLVWPRDLVETAGGLLAAGAHGEARRVLEYLRVTQEADGHWPQNMWLDGTPYWTGIQMDETAFPILLVALAQRTGALRQDQAAAYWPMIRRAAGFIVRNGPVTAQDRWEEDPGYSPFTLAVEIAALVEAADQAAVRGETAVADYLRQTADAWNAAIERWTYAEGTPLAAELGIDGYYIRIDPPQEAEAASPQGGFVPIKNRPPGTSSARAGTLLSPDALALVRFGLRAAGDPRIANTVRAIDARLKVDLPAGPAWHRYNGDGYGEHADGTPFDGDGIGRAWPLLVGERAHYELAAGRADVATRLLETMAGFAGDGGLLPEQVWDAADIPERGLFRGRPSGSAMPLVWAHAEYLKLARTLRDGRIFDLPPSVFDRYVNKKTASTLALWRPNQKLREIAAGWTLRVETPTAMKVRWHAGDGPQARELAARDTGLGLYAVDLPTLSLPAGTKIVFTLDGEGLPPGSQGPFEVIVRSL
jgi:glucoamylase